MEHPKERGPFFIVEKWHNHERRHSYEVMPEAEIEQDESLTLASGHFDTRAEAEAAFRQGVKDGEYEA